MSYLVTFILRFVSPKINLSLSIKNLPDMHTEKIKFLNSYLMTAITIFDTYLPGQPKEIPTIEKISVILDKDYFLENYDDFLDELRLNIREHRDHLLISGYLKKYLREVYAWKGFGAGVIDRMVSNEDCTDFLFRLKQNIDLYYGLIRELVRCEEPEECPPALARYFDEVKEEERKTLKTTGGEPAITGTPQAEEKVLPEAGVPEYDNRFEFEVLKEECDQLADSTQKIIFIHNRLFDLEQWQLMHDTPETTGNPPQTQMKYTQLYYPLFEKQCHIELKRLECLNDLERGKALPPRTSTPAPDASSPYVWKASDTHLLELVTALYKSGSIGKKDTSNLTRKELIEFFARIFNMEIKNVECKLSIATNRYDDTPCLDKLKRAFKEYIEEKNERMMARTKRSV